MFLGKYFPPSMVTKLRNEITNFRQRLDESLFEAWERYKLSIDRCPNHNMLPVTQIDTFYNGLTLRHRDTINAAAGETFMKRCPEECYDLIENMTAHHNDWDTLAQWSESSSSITSSSDPEIIALKAEMAKINKNLMRVLQENNQGRNQFFQGASHGPNPPPAYQSPTYQALGDQAPVHQPPIPQPQVLTTNEFTNYMKANDAILKNMQTNMTSLTNSNLELKNMFGQFMKINTALSSGSRTLPSNTITNPKEDLKGITTRSETAYQGPTIPTTSSSLPKVVEHETEVTKDTVPHTYNESTKDVQPSVVQVENSIPNYEPVVAPVIEPVVAPANDQKEKFLQIFQDLNFKISFADALIIMPKFGPTIKTLLTNKDKLSELARTLLNEHCSAVLFKKLPEKLGDPSKFLIPCDFSRMDECLAMADLDASINLMPLSVWNKLSLPEWSPICMTLELADCLISRPVRVAEDVFVKVGTFHFPTDFIVVDFDADPRVPLILRRSFLKIERALIDVFKGELTLHVGKEAITFNLDQTSRYSANYNDMMANRIDVIDMACEEYSQEVLGFSDVIASGNPTPYYDSIVSTSSPTLTPFGDSDFLLEEVDAFLALEDDPISPEDLPPHLEYTFLEGDDKLPVIISKDLSDEEKIALIKVLKSHKQAIAWKLSDIKGINLENCTRKILMEEDFKPAVQHQRRVNLKIHDVIKKEVEKILDAELIYPISDSPWVIPVHCVPKKGGFTIVENEENELIPNRLLMGWRVCIDYRKLNEATRKDHFPLPFMDQMLEKLEKSHFMVKKGIVLGHKISKNGIEVDKAKVDVIAKLPHPTTVKGIRSFLGHASFYRRLIQDFSKIARPMTRLLEKETSFFFSKECVEAFQTLKRKLIEATILIVPDWDLPFELMYDASDFVIGVVLGQLHYASKTMTEAESHYTTTEKEMLAVVYAFEKFRSNLIFKKSIVYTDQSALKYLFAKKDSKARLLRWVILLQEFKFEVINKKGAENLAVDHLSRLENPHQNVLDPKKINEAFPLETLNMVSFRGDSITPWFSDFANYHVGNFVIKSFGDVFTARNPLTFSRLATMDPSGDTMARTTPPKRCLTSNFIGPQSTVMPMTWSNLVTLVNVKERFHNSEGQSLHASRPSRLCAQAQSVDDMHFRK
uniref:RNA-directed DNA polymerase n=1 Tax=Tanacetum cinerariifolium TaxID=118510 RepID=A0A6L2MNX4_TANCI|nr:reverse transcriptase domain-containing protein [Tanacetum cinerariifolium]